MLNCTSYGNADKGYEDADGFAAKLTVGEGNVFDGCVAYNNADDGWDLYAKVETGCIGAVTIRNCVAYSNGVLEDGTIGGNGNGFKLGGESLSGKHVLENSYAFWNRSKGIDSNSCPDVIVHNCVSYNNGSHNVAFYTNNAGSTDFAATGIISFKDDTNPYKDGMNGDNLKPKGTQDTSKYLGKSNYYWYGSSSTNESGAAFTADMFASLEFKGVARNADGTIDMQGFLQLTAKAPANTGVVPGGTASEDVGTLPEDAAHNYSEEWYNEDDYRHWHECECGARGDMADHTFVWVVTKEATETTTGSKHEECTVCGHKKAAITTYYEKPAEPSDEPSAEPSGEPAAPTEPKPGNGGNNAVVIIVVVVVVVIIAAAAVIVLLKKKKVSKKSRIKQKHRSLSGVADVSFEPIFLCECIPQGRQNGTDDTCSDGCSCRRQGVVCRQPEPVGRQEITDDFQWRQDQRQIGDDGTQRRRGDHQNGQQDVELPNTGQNSREHETHAGQQEHIDHQRRGQLGEFRKCRTHTSCRGGKNCADEYAGQHDFGQCAAQAQTAGHVPKGGICHFAAEGEHDCQQQDGRRTHSQRLFFQICRGAALFRGENIKGESVSRFKHQLIFPYHIFRRHISPFKGNGGKVGGAFAENGGGHMGFGQVGGKRGGGNDPPYTAFHVAVSYGSRQILREDHSAVQRSSLYQFFRFFRGAVPHKAVFQQMAYDFGAFRTARQIHHTGLRRMYCFRSFSRQRNGGGADDQQQDRQRAQCPLEGE